MSNSSNITPVEASGSERESLVAIMRQHIKADASGLAPAVISHYLFGFEDAADAILTLLSARPLALGGQQGEEIDEDTPWPESPLATDLFNHVQSQYGLDNDEASEEAGDIIAILVKHGVDPTKLPARAEAQNEGAAGEPYGWIYERLDVGPGWCAGDEWWPAEFTKKPPVPGRSRNIITLYAHPSPPPAADEDRVLDAAADYLEKQYGASYGLRHPVDRQRIKDKIKNG